MTILNFMSNNNILTGFIIFAFFVLFAMVYNFVNDWFDKSLKLKYDLNKSILKEIKADLDMIFCDLNMEKKDETNEHFNNNISDIN